MDGWMECGGCLPACLIVRGEVAVDVDVDVERADSRLGGMEGLSLFGKR